MDERPAGIDPFGRTFASLPCGRAESFESRPMMRVGSCKSRSTAPMQYLALGDAMSNDEPARLRPSGEPQLPMFCKFPRFEGAAESYSCQYAGSGTDEEFSSSWRESMTYSVDLAWEQGPCLCFCTARPLRVSREFEEIGRLDELRKNDAAVIRGVVAYIFVEPSSSTKRPSVRLRCRCSRWQRQGR